VRTDEEITAQVLADINRDVRALRRKYSGYQKLFGDVLAKVLEEI
jgi:hypothetical protein